MNCPKCNSWMKLIARLPLENFIAFESVWVCIVCNLRIKQTLRGGSKLNIKIKNGK